MRKFLMLTVFAAALTAGAAAPAFAHCDSVDGPVAGAALRALETRNVNLALPYAPAAAEAEISRAFTQAAAVRGQGAEARAIADRWFMETVVRLHRAGEGAPYTGLRPAGTDFGPAIPAAERALATGEAAPLAGLLTHAVQHGMTERLGRARAAQEAPAQPRSAAEVPHARTRVSAEFAFIEYVEGIHQAVKGAAAHGGAEAGH
ncbi:DUF6448 family protein [Neoroseomonas soli]|nr:DUF6448 family protein [Neoroseomonas soli]